MRIKSTFWIGLSLIIGYWIYIHPAGFGRGYIEDHCTFEMSRQIMADQIREFGTPRFESQHYLYPSGTPTAYMPQSIEQTWLGAYFWNWNRDFPYFWAYFGVSLLLTYLGVGFILRKMGLSSRAAWFWSAGVTLFHIPRHMVTWYHSEHIYQHWLYLGFFLDAWIWQRFFREKKWSWTLELWRGFFMIAIFGTAGYFWGPSIVEWLVLRISLFTFFALRQRKGISTQIEGSLKKALAPFILSLAWIGIELVWFLPLMKKAKELGTINQALIYHAPVFMVLRPLWFDWVMTQVEKIVPFIKGLWWSFQQPETKVTIGWFFWIPAILGIRFLRKKHRGPGVLAAFPFLVLLGIAIWYLGIKPHWVQHFLQSYIPFMIFFRVASRWGLFLPQIITVIIALSWPELSRWWDQRFQNEKRKYTYIALLFISSSLIESVWLFRPATMMAPLSNQMTQFLEDIRKSPGTAVLDMPFCTLGGNDICMHQCAAYPYSTAGACFRQWHDKDVYGIYQSRMVLSQCETYSKQPFASWIDAWRGNRCFTPQEWSEFCDHLEHNSNLSAVLLYPELWPITQAPQCQSEWLSHLGNPLAEGAFSSVGNLGGIPQNLIRVIKYQPRCLFNKK